MRKHLPPGRFPVQKICQSKKNGVRARYTNSFEAVYHIQYMPIYFFRTHAQKIKI